MPDEMEDTPFETQCRTRLSHPSRTFTTIRLTRPVSPRDTIAGARQTATAPAFRSRVGSPISPSDESRIPSFYAPRSDQALTPTLHTDARVVHLRQRRNPPTYPSSPNTFGAEKLSTSVSRVAGRHDGFIYYLLESPVVRRGPAVCGTPRWFRI